jgi:hypothetical protein
MRFDTVTMQSVQPHDEDEQTDNKIVEIFTTPALLKRGDADGEKFDVCSVIEPCAVLWADVPTHVLRAFNSMAAAQDKNTNAHAPSHIDSRRGSAQKNVNMQQQSGGDVFLDRRAMEAHFADQNIPRQQHGQYNTGRQNPKMPHTEQESGLHNQQERSQRACVQPSSTLQQQGYSQSQGFYDQSSQRLGSQPPYDSFPIQAPASIGHSNPDNVNSGNPVNTNPNSLSASSSDPNLINVYKSDFADNSSAELASHVSGTEGKRPAPPPKSQSFSHKDRADRGGADRDGVDRDGADRDGADRGETGEGKSGRKKTKLFKIAKGEKEKDPKDKESGRWH